MRKTTLFAVAALAAIAAQGAMAQEFNTGLPAGWTTAGTAGTLGADGVVTLSGVAGSTAYGYVTTTGSTASGIGYNLGHETNGSTLTSSVFTATAGTALNFNFNYVTSDGSTFADYAFANLLNASDGSLAAVLFNARTEPNGSIAPGFELPTPVATLTPSSTPIIGGGPDWSPLGASSGQCFSGGCGYTGWISSTYSIATAGSYELQFGVVNWSDIAYDSGLAIDGVTVGGVPIAPVAPVPPIVPSVPEPGTYALMFAGLALVGYATRRRSK